MSILLYVPPGTTLNNFTFIYVFCMDLSTNSDYFPMQHSMHQEYPQTGKLVHGFPWSSPDIPNAQLASKIHATLRDFHAAFRKLTSQFPPKAALTTSSKFRHNDSCQARNSASSPSPPQINVFPLLRAPTVPFPSPCFLYLPPIYNTLSLPLQEGRAGITWEPSEQLTFCFPL